MCRLLALRFPRIASHPEATKVMRAHYEKVICACCFLVLFTNIGLPSTSFAVYQPYIVAIPDVGDTGGSIILAVRVLVTLGAMFVVDRYYHALDARRGAALSMACTAAGFAVYGMAGAAQSLPLFFAGSVLCGFGYGLGGMIAATMLVNRWFASGIGTALGVASVGSGVASIVIPLAVERIIAASSLSTAFLCEAGLALVLALIVLAFLRNRPSDMGLAPFESKVVQRRADRNGDKGADTARLRPLPRRAHTALMAAQVATGAFSMGGCAYLSVLFVTSGIDLPTAALLVSVAGICLTVAKFVMGEVIDRVGTRTASACVFAVLLVGLAACCAVSIGGTPLAVVAAVCTGLGISLGSVGTSVWSLELSDEAHRTKSIKDCQIGYAFGGLLMNVLPGPLMVLTGTYAVSYALMGVLAAFAAFVVLRIYRRYRS